MRILLANGNGEQIRNESPQRLAFALLDSLELLENGSVNIDRGSRDALMIERSASDVNLGNWINVRQGAWQFCGAFPLRAEQGSAGTAMRGY